MVSACTIALAVHVLGFPLWFPVATLIDLVWRNRFSTVRLGLFVTLYLAMELLGVAAATVLWIVHGGPLGSRGRRWHDRHVALQRWWSGTLFAAARRLVKLHLEVEGESESDLGRGPLLVLIRHAGLVDVLLPSHLIANRHRLHLRFVLDAELLWDPCLDIVGHRLGDVFVRRSSGSPEAQIARITGMLDDLGEDEDILLFPEGARYTARRREQVRRLFDGSAIGTVVRIRVTRVPRAAIPEGDDARTAWLFDRWQEIDDWIDAHRSEA